MQKDLLFYQANFDPEINRSLDALEISDEKHFLFFKSKTLKILEEILNFPQKFAGKEEWFAIKSIVSDLDFASTEEKQLLRSYGVPFSVKFALKLNTK